MCEGGFFWTTLLSMIKLLPIMSLVLGGRRKHIKPGSWNKALRCGLSLSMSHLFKIIFERGGELLNVVMRGIRLEGGLHVSFSASSLGIAIALSVSSLTVWCS